MWIIFNYLNLWTTSARHNFKWVKIRIKLNYWKLSSIPVVWTTMYGCYQWLCRVWLDRVRTYKRFLVLIRNWKIQLGVRLQAHTYSLDECCFSHIAFKWTQFVYPLNLFEISHYILWGRHYPSDKIWYLPYHMSTQNISSIRPQWSWNWTRYRSWCTCSPSCSQWLSLWENSLCIPGREAS